jgi:UDP-N-acetyl-D-glucosamine dehydrogenase
MSLISVVGLGYVGMPLAQAAVANGLNVIGFDTNSEVVAGLARGRSHIDDVSDDEVALMIGSGFRPTDDESQMAKCTIFVICVPTPLAEHGGPDLASVTGAGVSVGNCLKRGDLVVLESTSYPGATEEVLLPILEARSGLRAGVDFHLAFSPERIDPGNIHFRFSNTPKVVGGLTPNCLAAASKFYSPLVERVVP